jgi:DNA invertase Pin-like site-specific DNA recombinase
MASGSYYHDLGVSAFKGANLQEGALGKFIQAAEQRQIPAGSYLLVESLDRISRQKVTDALAIFLRIVNAGVTLVTLCSQLSIYRCLIGYIVWQVG